MLGGLLGKDGIGAELGAVGLFYYWFKVKCVIFFCMVGGFFYLEIFDYKFKFVEFDGKSMFVFFIKG